MCVIFHPEPKGLIRAFSADLDFPVQSRIVDPPLPRVGADPGLFPNKITQHQRCTGTDLNFTLQFLTQVA
jgi:hypothetical protein